MKKQKNLTIAIAISVSFLLLYNIVSFAHQCEEVRSDVIRLHILANSDSEADQELKLKVRDAILEEGNELFDGSVTKENATEKLEPQLANLQKIAEKVITENGFDYGATVTLATEYFDTRCYQDEITLPAGKYLALKIILGEGDGHNWWCVMFPSLCLPAAEKTDSEALEDVFSENEIKAISRSEKFEVRFKIVETIEKWKNRNER